MQEEVFDENYVSLTWLIMVVQRVDCTEENLSKMCTVQQIWTEVEKLWAEVTCLKQQFIN